MSNKVDNLVPKSTSVMVKIESIQEDITMLSEPTYSKSDDSINRTQRLDHQFGELIETIHSMSEDNDWQSDITLFLEGNLHAILILSSSPPLSS